MVERDAAIEAAARPEATLSEDTRAPTLGTVSGFDQGAQVAGRFLVTGQLGHGSSGEVLSVKDLSLDREVAMKVLRGAGGPAIARFMREARVTARLDHPSVPPVYTLDFLPDGGLIFTMRRLEGMTLGEALRKAQAGSPPPVVSGINATVSLGLRVCEALARAHHLGVIHRDVKPDNIMLGSHGEVALVDWGECRLLGEEEGGAAGSTVGTPAYMSPEQARGEPADASSDVYALAASLYHVLTGIYPTWDQDPERFWDKKRAGIVDPLAPEVERKLPRPLLAILRRALLADSTARYASVVDFAADLERFQSGLAVAAYRDTPLESLLRWSQRHRTALLATAAVLVVCLVAGGMLLQQHLRQMADWGPPILVEDFSDPSWRERWFTAEPEQWSVQDGRLVSQGRFASYLTLDQPLAGAVAIEYDGEILPGSQQCDLSVIWTEDPEHPHGRMVNGSHREYWVQAGAYDNYFCAIFRRPEGSRLDQRPFRLTPGVTHHFRVELDGQRIGMWIDGQQTLAAEERLPIATGNLCLYGYYPGKAFDNVRVYQKRLPEVAPVLAIGDAFLKQHMPVQAAAAYREVSVSHPSTELAVEARYLQGLAWREAGNLAKARTIWSGLPPGLQADRVEGHLLDVMHDSGRIIDACRSLSALYHRAPAVRDQLRSQWQAWAIHAMIRPGILRDHPTVSALIDTKLALFPDHHGSDLECGNLLNALGRGAEVLQRFPLEVVPCADALLRLGRPEEILQRFADAPGPVNAARMELGRFEDILADQRVDPWSPNGQRKVFALCQAGRIDDVFGIPGLPIAIAQLWQGRPDLVLAGTPSPDQRVLALAALGRIDEIAAGPPSQERDFALELFGRGDIHLGGGNPMFPAVGLRLIGLTSAGELAMRDQLAAGLASQWPDWRQWFLHLVLVPVVRQDPVLLRQRLETAWTSGRTVAGARPYHLAGYALGRLPGSTFATAPCAGEQQLWSAVGEALRAELQGDRERIRQAWGAYLHLPWHRRLTVTLAPDPDIEGLARFRSAQESPP